MQSQLTCPRCQTPFTAEVNQVVDVGRRPELKSMLLNGYLNLAQCPACSAVTQVTTPILYHDPAHEMFMVYVPLELSLEHTEQEKLIGQLVQQAMDSLPPEQRKGYMLQPQTVMSMQSLLEKVLETEGVTPEMIARQKDQSALLNTMLSSDRATTDELIKSRADELDETFFAILRATLESVEKSGRDEEALKLINLQAKLYQDTEYGRRLERQQRALHNFNREIKQSGELSPKLLLKHVLANRDDALLVEALIAAGQPAFNYDFFVLLSERIDKRQKAGINADELLQLREELLQTMQAIEKRRREALESAQGTLRELLQAEDVGAAVRDNLSRLDDTFMFVLSHSIAEARQRGNEAEASALQSVQEQIISEIEEQAPPEIRLMNQLLRLESESEREALLAQNEHLVDSQLLQMVEAIGEQARDSGDRELDKRLKQVQVMIEANLQR